MPRGTLELVEFHPIKVNTSDICKAKAQYLKGFSRLAFSMTKIVLQDKYAEGDSIPQPPHIRFITFSMGKVERSHFRVRLVLQRKSRSRKRNNKRPDEFCGIPSHELIQGGNQSPLSEMDILLNLGFSSENRVLRNNSEFNPGQQSKQTFRLYGQENFGLHLHYTSNDEDDLLSFPEMMQNRADKIFCPPPMQKHMVQRRKLLILDINGLLADIVSPAPKECTADLKFRKNAVFKRPFCRDFMKFCLERFDVGIWSSRNRKNVDKVVDYLMGDLKHKLLFCWDLSQCTATGYRTLENRHKPVVFKEVRRVWECFNSQLPWERCYYDESNTLLLDDSPYKALLNPPNTAIFPRSYCFQNKSDSSLAAGGDLRVYLEKLASAKNVQRYVARHPFGQRAITERSKSWSFYNRVLTSVMAASQQEELELEEEHLTHSAQPSLALPCLRC